MSFRNSRVVSTISLLTIIIGGTSFVKFSNKTTTFAFDRHSVQQLKIEVGPKGARIHNLFGRFPLLTLGSSCVALLASISFPSSPSTLANPAQGISGPCGLTPCPFGSSPQSPNCVSPARSVPLSECGPFCINYVCASSHSVPTSLSADLMAGGDVTPGKAYVVAEKRPEVFMPRSAGTIIACVERHGRRDEDESRKAECILGFCDRQLAS